MYRNSQQKVFQFGIERLVFGKIIGSQLFSLVEIIQTHTIHVWYIYLHLVDLYGKCRYIYQSHGCVMGKMFSFHRVDTYLLPDYGLDLGVL